MHESGLVASLVARVEALVVATGASPRRIGVKVGGLSGVQPASLRAHWERLAGPSLAAAQLDIEVEDEAANLGATGLTLLYVDVADPGSG